MPKYQNIISRLLSLAIFIGCVVLSPALAQNQAVIDSLNLRLKTATDQQRFELLQRLFREYNQNDFNTALRYAEDAYKLANALGDSSKIVEGGRMMAFSLMDLGRNEEAIKILNRSLKIAYRNIDRYPDIKPKIKYLLNNTGIAYMYRGNYDSSLSYHFESLAIRDEEGDKKSLGTALNNIGLVFFKLKSFEQALQYYQRSLDLKNELGDKSDLDKILINIGLCYNSLGDANQAIKSFNKAIASCAPDCGETQRKEVYFGLANAYNVLKKIDSAEVNYKRSIAIAKNQSDKQYWMENLVGLMQIENERKNYLMGIRYLDEALQFESQLQLPEPLISLYTQAAKIYLLNDDYKQSAFYQGKYIKLKDSIISGDLIKNLAKIQATFEERENLKTISEKNRVLQLQNELISRQKTQYLFVVVILILSTGLALVLIWANRKQRIQSVALNQAKQMIGVQNEKLKEINNSLDKQIEEKTEDLIKTNRALKEVNNEMDHFIYRTSHDIRGPLVTLKGICNVALLDVKDPVAIDYFHKLNHTSEKLNLILTRLLMVNRISRWELAPEEINFIGLIESIIRLDYPGGIPNNISFEYRVDADVKIYSDFFLLKVIIENLLANSFKFYNTSGRVEPFVKIEISRAPDKNILIKVKDNGIGIVTDDLSHIFQLFNRASERSEIGGVGLYLCKLAAIRLGGFIELTDSSPSGTEFHVLIPNDVNPLIVLRRMQEERFAKEVALKEQKNQA